MKKKLNIKAILIPVIAIILIAAVVITAVSLSASKPLAAFNAARETVFESSQLKVSFYFDGKEANTIDATFGDDIDTSSFVLTKKGIEAYALKNGEIELGGRSIGKIDDIIDRMQSMALSEYGAELGINTKSLDFIEIIDSLVNGKLDEEAFADFYDNEVLPELEKRISEEVDATVVLPYYEDTIKIVERFLKKGLTEEALTFEKIESEEEGMTYGYSLNVEELAVCIGEFAKSDKEVREILESIIEQGDSGYESVDAFVADYVEAYDDADILTGEVTVDSGRITRATCDYDGHTFEIRITSVEA